MVAFPVHSPLLDLSRDEEKKSDDLERCAFEAKNEKLRSLDRGQVLTLAIRIAQFFRLLTSRLTRFFLPTWLDSSFKYPAKSPISTLDGLRGLASLIVLNHHFVKLYESDDFTHWIHHAPFVRFFWNGKGPVSIFFTISGYVLCYRPLQLIRKQDSAAFMKSMSSAILRRGFRLYLPCLVASFIMLWLTYFGAFARPAEVHQYYTRFLVLGEAVPPQDRDLRGLFYWYWHNVQFIFSSTFPFEINLNEDSWDMFDLHQWTIPVEMRGSMAVFALLIGISRMATLWRLAAEVLAFYYLYQTNRIYICMFFIGLFLCDLDLTRRDYYANNPHHAPCCGTLVNHVLRALFHRSETFYRFAYLSIFVLGYYMISSVKENTVGNWLGWQIESRGWTRSPDAFLYAWGAAFGVWAVANSPALAPFFNSRPIQYLGNISYALYLVHGPVIRSIGYLWLPTSLHLGTGTPFDVALDSEWWATVTPLGCVLSNVFGLLVVGGISFWFADIFWTNVDMRVVKFAKQAENFLTAGYNG